MIEIKKMFHNKTGEVIFEDIEGKWYRFDYYSFDPMRSVEAEWEPVVASKIEKPE